VVQSARGGAVRSACESRIVVIKLKPVESTKGAFQVLCLGCHSDDIEIGCGGAILQLAAERPEARFSWVVFSADGVRGSEARQGVAQILDASRLTTLMMQPFPDGFMPYVGADIKRVFEELKHSTSPDVIFTHNRHDAHQDHRLIADLTWNTFRDHLILEYEIPKYDGDMGCPGVFMPLSKDVCEKKVDVIVNTFRSQSNKRWFDRETFLSLMRLRGMECNSPSGYAEAFYGRKILL
jgi:LmbE family N-acetylglucosaminyl deacetylase